MAQREQEYHDALTNELQQVVVGFLIANPDCHLGIAVSALRALAADYGGSGAS